MHFNIYEQNKFRAQLGWAWKQFYNLGPVFGISDQEWQEPACLATETCWNDEILHA